MATDIIFLLVITVFAVIGAKKGCIKTIGGLLSILVSWFISRALAAPIGMNLINVFGIQSHLDSAAEIINSGITDYTGTITTGIPGVRLPNMLGMSNGITQAISGVVNVSMANVFNMLVMILLFSVCMFICGLIIRAFQSVFEKIPLGTTVNTLFGGICGIIKGLIIAILIYYVMYILNTTLNTNIPLDGVVINRVFEIISHIHL